jgi:hypothetical protein
MGILQELTNYMDFSKILSQSSWIQQDWTLCYIKKCFCHENMEHIIFVFQIKDSKVHILVRTCLHRSMSERTKSVDCPTAAQLSVNTSTSSVLQDSVVVPYPKAGTWFITLNMSCFTGGINEKYVTYN